MNIPLNKGFKRMCQYISHWRKLFNTEMRQVNRFLFFRISIGVFLMYKALALAPYWMDFYSETGFFTREILEVSNVSKFLSYFQFSDFISVTFGMEITSVFLMMKSFFILCSVFLIFGLFTRLSVLILLFINVMLTNTFPEYSYGVDYFLSSLLFYSLFFPLGLNQSLDAKFFPAYLNKLRRGIKEKWAILIMGIHLSIVYFIGGLSKAFGPTWWNGEAVWKAMNRPANDLVPYFIEFIDFKIGYIALGIATILVELLYPVFIWVKRTQPIWLFLTLMMHLFIGVIMELYLFASVMVFYNLIAFSNFSDSNQFVVSKSN